MLLSKNLPLWLSLAAVGVAAPVTNTTTSEWVNLLQWADCPEGPPGLQCASLEVPLDYKNPSGKQVNLGLTRVQSPNANRTGSLVYGYVNPSTLQRVRHAGHVVKIECSIFTADLVSPVPPSCINTSLLRHSS